MQDKRIIEMIITANDGKALAELYRHFPMMRKMILTNGGTKEDSEDIFQEALIIFCRKVKEQGFELKSQLSTYLFSVCRFLWKDELKKRNRLKVADFQTGFNTDEEQGLEDLLEKEKQAKMAERILNELGDRCRELLMLFYNVGLKLRDIASRMGYSSEDTAKNQKYKCLEGARKRLEELKSTSQTY